MIQYVLYITLLLTRIHASIYAIIPDCDEVFNYWEPLNFLTRFFGKQTWEYSPEFAIRSYGYLTQFSLFIYPINLIKYFSNYHNLNLPSYSLFYLIRFIMAISFTLAEIKLSKTLKFLNKSIGNWFLISQIFSPGMYQASISILPSTYTLLLGIISTNYIIQFFNTEKFISSIDNELYNLEKKSNDIKDDNSKIDELAPRTNMLLNLYSVSSPIITKSFTMVTLLTSIAGFVGWPFSMILISPFIIYTLLNSLYFQPKSILKTEYSSLKTFSTYLLSGISCAFFIAYFISQLDGLFYKKISYIAFNILSYNVLNTSNETGPDIFGIENSFWYAKNLLLNFHLFFIIAILNFLTIFNKYQLIIYKLPLLIWFLIFNTQPHKEERFIYPVYHLISISFAQFMSCETFNLNCFTKIFKKILNYFILFISIFIFLTRINNLNSNYSAPINIFKYLSDNSNNNLIQYNENICIGREWYHYPSSFFLQNNQRLKFTNSSFNGMLPGDFIEPKIHSFEGLVNSTSLLPIGFNNKNKFNPNFLIDNNSNCNYFIDIIKPINEKFNEISILNNNDWEIIYCNDILDVDNSYGIEKSLNIKNFLNTFIRKPWLNLQDDLSVIELNRKLMQMYGIKNPNGTQMFDGIYDNLKKLNNLIDNNFGNYLGEVKTNKFCIASRKTDSIN
ncbi:mannosyltransferase [Pichia californica]|uniref:Mannosyltransferase n=1 Tax=Pichia californica TaxID=460514 RepID=A0A9P6WL34_9ASCO|nr:mannosyltransferase [[Candida] californica]